MRVVFDTEFYENGKTIELISIGLAREDGATYYAEFIEGYPFWYEDPWVAENVVKHLRIHDNPVFCPCYKSRQTIAGDILQFVGPNPEFWAYYADYDWVALCQLYGRMIDLPKGWPMFCRDLKQLAVDLGSPELPAQRSTEHVAIDDALWGEEVYQFLMKEKAKNT